MRVLGWVILAGIAILAIGGIYKSLRMGLKAVAVISTKGVLAAIAAFASYLLLSVILGDGVFAGQTFFSLSLTLGVPLLLGMLAQGASTRLPKL